MLIRHNKYQGTPAVHRTTNLLLTVAACGLVYGRWIKWRFFLQLNNIQKSVSFAQDFLTFIVWKNDEKVILFSFPAYGTTNTRPIFLCCWGPLITVWICNTYRWEVEHKLEYNPCKSRSSILGCFLFFLFCQEIFFVC